MRRKAASHGRPLIAALGVIVKIHYESTEESFRRSAEIVGNEYWPTSLSDRLVYFGFGFGAFVLLLSVIDLFRKAPHLSSEIWWLVGGAVVFIILSLVLLKRGRSTDFSAVAQHLPVDVEVSISDDWLHIRTEMSEVKTRAASIVKVSDFEDGMAIFILGGECVFIPASAFESDDAKQEFHNMLIQENDA